MFYAELNEFFARELSSEGYSGCEVRVTPARTEIIIRATQTQDVLGEKGRRIRELTSLIQKRFNFMENTVELYAEKVAMKGLSAVAQCESLKYKLLQGLAVRRYSPPSPLISFPLELAIAWSVSSWNLELKVAKSLSAENLELLVPSP